MFGISGLRFKGFVSMVAYDVCVSVCVCVWWLGCC